jgi:hypothetical protein
MKIKQIEKLCKAAGYVMLVDGITEITEVEEGEPVELPRQWMGDGGAMYPLDGMPFLTEDGVCAIFDLDAKKRQNICITHKPQLPGGIDFEDLHKGDKPLEALKLQMSIGGDELRLFRDEDGALLVIKAAYTKPFENWKEVECYKRIDASGKPYVAVMSGCILRGTIYPYKIGEQLVETLGEVYNAAGVAAEAEQMKI